MSDENPYFWICITASLNAMIMPLGFAAFAARHQKFSLRDLFLFVTAEAVAIGLPFRPPPISIGMTDPVTPPRRRWSFSLRTLFAVVTVLAVGTVQWTREKLGTAAWDHTRRSIEVLNIDRSGPPIVRSEEVLRWEKADEEYRRRASEYHWEMAAKRRRSFGGLGSNSGPTPLSRLVPQHRPSFALTGDLMT